MSAQIAAAEDKRDRPSYLVPAAAALGLMGGVLFGDAAFALVARVWNGVVLPAYLEVQNSGIPFCS